MKHVKLFEQFIGEAVNPSAYVKAGKLGYNDQFLGRQSLSKTLSLDLGLNPKHEYGGGDWLGFDHVTLYATGGKKAGNILGDALTGKYTYDELKAAAADFLGIKESVVNEAKNPNPQMFADMFSETMADIEGSGKELSNENLLYMLERAWKVVAEQNNLRERGNALWSAFWDNKIKTDQKFMGKDLGQDAERFGNAAYGETAYHYDGMIECFGHVITELGLLNPAQWKKVKKSLEA
jgi:hypothetical protein